jgi:hypothetical protein
MRRWRRVSLSAVQKAPSRAAPAVVAARLNGVVKHSV